MESARGIAVLAVEALEEGNFDFYGSCLVDLEAMLQGRREERQALLLDAGVHKAYLKQAHLAAQAGDGARAERFLAKAVAYVGETEVATLAEENRYRFVARQPVMRQLPERQCEFFC